MCALRVFAGYVQAAERFEKVPLVAGYGTDNQWIVPYSALMTTCAVYLRISKDKALGTEDEGLAVDRQRKAIHKLLKARNWTVGREYLDNDVSASGKVSRPAYAAMLSDFESGELDAIAAWKLDRLWRVPKELEHIIELVERSSLTVATVDNDIDLNTSTGRVMARVLTAFAQDELDKRSARQKAKFAQDREAGRNHWRGRRPFGLTLEGKEVPEEAESLRAIAESILDGGTISAACDYLNSRGIKTTFGGKWERQPLRTTFLKPRLAGLLEHEGELIPGKWDAVLDRDTWEAVVAVLKTPGRKKSRSAEGRYGREYLLSGLLTCGECGGRCYGVPSDRKLADGSVKRNFFYRCAKTHISKSMQRVDDLVIMRTFAAFMDINTEEVVADRKALKALREARAAEVKRWSDWMAEAVTEQLRPSEIRPNREAHEKKLSELDRAIHDFEKVSLVRMPTDEEADEGIVRVFEWDAMPLEKRRRMVETVFESITLLGGKKGDRWSDEKVVFKARL